MEGYWLAQRGGVSAETFSLEEKAKKITEAEEEDRRKALAKLIIEPTLGGRGKIQPAVKPMSTLTIGEKSALQPLFEEKARVEAGEQSSFGGGYSGGTISRQRHTTVQPNESPFAGAFAGQQKPEATQAPSPQLNTMSPFMQSLMQNHPPEQQPIGGGQ